MPQGWNKSSSPWMSTRSWPYEWKKICIYLWTLPEWSKPRCSHFEDTQELRSNTAEWLCLFHLKLTPGHKLTEGEETGNRGTVQSSHQSVCLLISVFPLLSPWPPSLHVSSPVPLLTSLCLHLSSPFPMQPNYECVDTRPRDHFIPSQYNIIVPLISQLLRNAKLNLNLLNILN